MVHVCTVNWALLLEYLKVFLAWPVIVGIGAIVAVVLFRDEVKSLVNRIASFEIAGAKLVTQQAVPDAADAENVPAPVAVNDAAPAALENPQIPAPERAQLQTIFEAERAAARMWEYRYLNYFLAPGTQSVINWFVGLPNGTTMDAYEAFWMNRVPQASERGAILSALERHFLLQLEGEQIISITAKGREYAGWAERKIISVPPEAYLPMPPQTI
ncbi:hypothetical protein [Paraburkholderia sp. BCC1885]|uniref:hypothetical protein n=1 Tax=Paraburkholderia sp. BCC1885 TaxID=2562669 RepID=UPI001183FF6F|nr:hypothetical protein [Paraburkholderia sp. BCC1885]